MGRAAFWLAVALCFVQGCLAQDLSHVNVICVVWPVGNSAEAKTARATVSERLRGMGYQTADCVANPDVAYDVQLWFYPYGGAVQSDKVFFYGQFGASPGGIVGSVIVDQPTVSVGYWMIELWPKGRYLAMYRNATAPSLAAGLKRMDKDIRKAKKRARK